MVYFPLHNSELITRVKSRFVDTAGNNEKARKLDMILINHGATSGGITWPTSVKCSGGTAPSLSASGTDVVSFTTIDGGTAWYGFVGGIGFS